MIASLLIANRGEIARRILRTAQRMGIRTIAVHSDVDAAMPFVREADAAVCIGTALPRDSYLRQDRILEAARATGAQAIHPGYGFLSENAGFAEAVLAAGLIWVGAPPAAIRAMGLKDAAKERMIAAGVPVTPGYLGADQAPDRLQSEADAIGYPVLIKAVAGGGGKGMRRVDAPAEFAELLASCRREAAAAFGDDRVLIEKYILSPRHIEVQVFGDTHGRIVHLFERDCSLQRRHQKVIEEAPAPDMDPATREAVCGAAVKAARAVGYVGAGTIEFIADGSQGLRGRPDLVHGDEHAASGRASGDRGDHGRGPGRWQLRVAAGEPLPMRQEELAIHGWAMEARLYAENPATGFLPSIGRLDRLRFPADIRVDSGVEEGGEVTPFYDPMIAKLIVHGATRVEAAAKLAQAARMTQVWPVRTNAALLARAAADPEFVAGRVDTGFIERHAARLVPAAEPSAAVLQAAAHAILPDATHDPWTSLHGFRANAAPADQVEVDVASKPYLVALASSPPAATIADGVLFLDGEAWPFGRRRFDRAGGEGVADGALFAPMPGRVIAVLVAQGQAVTRGERLLVLEAMKMEQALVAPLDGVVVALHAIAARRWSTVSCWRAWRRHRRRARTNGHDAVHRDREGESSMRTKLSVCLRKARFPSEPDALLFARRAGLALRPYRCDRCGRFHLTSRTRGKRMPRPRLWPKPGDAVYGTRCHGRRGSPTMIATVAELDRVRAECRRLVTSRSAMAAAAAVVPLPGIDIAADVGLLTTMLPQISARFELDHDHVRKLEPQIAQKVLVLASSLGNTAIGRSVTRMLVTRILRRAGARIAAASVAKYVPIAGSAFAATIGFGAMKLGRKRACRGLLQDGTLPDLRVRGRGPAGRP